MRVLSAFCLIIGAWFLPIGEAHNQTDMIWRMIPSFVVLLLVLYISTQWWSIAIASIEGFLNFLNYMIIDSWPEPIWAVTHYDEMQRIGFLLELIIIAGVALHGIDYRRIHSSIQHHFNRTSRS